MKSNIVFTGFGHILAGFLPAYIPDKSVREDIITKYRHIIRHSKDIGKRNPLLSAYALAAFFIAMNKADGLSAEENYKILEKGLRNSKLVRLAMGSPKSYFSDKHMAQRKTWCKETHRRIYENDWVVDFVPEDETYKFGYNYLSCGVCKLCRDENCPQLAQYLCRLDYLLVEIMGIGLDRTQTLAEGGSCCDFRFYTLDSKSGSAEQH